MGKGFVCDHEKDRYDVVVEDVYDSCVLSEERAEFFVVGVVGHELSIQNCESVGELYVDFSNRAYGF